MAFTLIIIRAVLFLMQSKILKKKSHLIISRVQQSPIKCFQIILLRNIHFPGLLPKQQTELLIFFLLSCEKIE